MNKDNIYIFICAFLGCVITWYIQHEILSSYEGIYIAEAIIANGIVGIIAAILLPPKIAGATYTASFVGMSSLNALPNLFMAALSGLIVASVILLTKEIYQGIGGKGGTTAALSVQITRAIEFILG